jgi:hypothetical protein
MGTLMGRPWDFGLSFRMFQTGSSQLFKMSEHLSGVHMQALAQCPEELS